MSISASSNRSQALPWVSADSAFPGSLTRSQAKKLKEFTARHEDPLTTQVRQTPELVGRILHFLPDEDLENACLVSKMFCNEAIRAGRDLRKEDIKVFQEALSKKLIDHANQIGVTPEKKNSILQVASQISSVRLNEFESMKTLKEVDSLCKKLEEKFAAYLGTLEDTALVPTIFGQLRLPNCFREVFPKAVDWTQYCLKFKDAMRNNHFIFTSEIIFDLCSKFEDVIPEYKACSKVLEAVLAPPVDGFRNRHFDYLIENSSLILSKITEPEIKKQLFTIVINHYLQAGDAKKLTDLILQKPEFEPLCEESIKAFYINANSDTYAHYLHREVDLLLHKKDASDTRLKNAKAYARDTLSSFCDLHNLPHTLEIIQKITYPPFQLDCYKAILDASINNGQSEAWLEATLQLRSTNGVYSVDLSDTLENGAISLLNLGKIEEAFKFVHAYLEYKDSLSYSYFPKFDLLKLIYDKTGQNGIKRFFNLLFEHPKILTGLGNSIVHRSNDLDANLLAEICSLIPVSTANRFLLKSFTFHSALEGRALHEIRTLIKKDGLLPNLAPIAVGGTTAFISKSITLARGAPSFISRVAVSARDRTSAAANWMFRTAPTPTSFSENLKRSDDEDSDSIAKRPRMFDVD